MIEIEVNDHVVRKDTTHPIGLVVAVNGNLTCTVRWGIADGHVYSEELPQERLDKLYYHISSPDEVIKRQAEEAQASYLKKEE